jgi:multidrug efflux pump subunit AcrB
MGAAILISLLVSFTLTPMLSSRLLRLQPEGERRKTILERFTDAFYQPIERVYMAMLRFALRHRWVIVLAAIGTLVSIVPLIKKVPKAFLPKNDEAQFQIDVRTPEGTSLAATQIAAERIAREVRQWPEVRTTVASIGDNQQKTPNLASIFVRLVPPDGRKASQDELQNRVRNEIVSKLPKDYRTSVSIVAAFGAGAFSTATVQYILNGPNEKLAHYSDQIVAKLKAVKGAVDVDTTFVTGNPELVATVDRRKAADLGVNVLDVALASQLLIGGVKVSRFEEAGRDYDILVRADEAARTSPEALRQLTVASSKLGTVPLLDVVDLKKAEGPSKIERFARQRRVMFLANTAPGVGSGEVGAELEKEVKAMKLPPEYSFSAFGQSKEIKRTGLAFLFAFGMSFLFMYLILAAQFESWLHPITILLSLPLTVPFALVSLIFLKSSLDIFTMLGILVLFGVVKKNSILQIAHIIQLRAEGYSRFDAIMHGNRDRLRPILMTTFAFVAGMFPLVTSHGIGAEFNRATAGPVVVGQLLSLLLTLLATPVAYTFFDDMSSGFRRSAGWIGRTLFGWKPQTPAETGADEIMGPPPVSHGGNGRPHAEAAE